MHVPDGFLHDPVSVATAVAATGAVAVAIVRSKPEIREAGMAKVALVAALIFAAQMVNFPVATGTSGHLIGAALAVALIGPWSAVLALTAVLAVQALVFADGGVTALGTNVLLMGVVAVAAANLALRGLRGLLPETRWAQPLATFVAGLVSVPAAALAFAALYAVGGATEVPLGELFGAMAGWHLLIGLGEGLVSAAVVALVAVAGARREPAALAFSTLIAAAGLSLVASAHPDGLEFVAGEVGFLGSARESLLSASPFADYGLTLVDGPAGTAIAGVVGAGLTLVVMALLAQASGERTARS